ncbi:two-component system sensor histidine kinase NtrB [Candidatus Nitronereus thalassa]|uniref:histidine kinase n=1 Tax=Candidatus Nitronereus thalassa TaxID=3020898 RepID=A0ABU3K699_9BACT|nr:ATP-binding protein [Candidatus Nitronereus thalassa]MDT7041925.1 ATP-binding protein [Candidatus Nitronereus thalassa]
MRKTKSRTSSLTVPSLSRDVVAANAGTRELSHLAPHQLESELRAHTLALDSKLQEIASLRQQHDSLLGTLELGVVATNSTGRVISVNAMAEKLLGTTRQHMMGHSLFQVWKACGLPEVPFSSIRHGDRFLTGYDQMQPAIGPRGHGGIRILKDVTMLTTLQGQLANQQRLAVMGEMIGTIAHEIRNPLASIELFASLLGTSIQDDAERQTLAKQIARVVRSLDHVLSNLLLMTKNVAPNFHPVPLDTIVHDVIMMGMHAIRERSVSVSENLRHSPRLICVDEPLFKQALLNLLLNAIQSSTENGVIEISSRWVSIDTSREGLAGNHAREAMVISVRDNGCGIQKEDQERMFEPFFSKRRGGTGLGLAIVRQIMDVHQGWVECESAPGEGTTIALWVPQGREGS